MSFNFQKGELILIDKELEWTSFDVVNKLRSSIKRKLKIKKLKVVIFLSIELVIRIDMGLLN